VKKQAKSLALYPWFDTRSGRCYHVPGPLSRNVGRSKPATSR